MNSFGGEGEPGLMDGEENTGCGAGSETSRVGAPCARGRGRLPTEAVPAEVLGAHPGAGRGGSWETECGCVMYRPGSVAHHFGPHSIV